MTLRQRIQLDLSLPVAGVALLFLFYAVNNALLEEVVSSRADGVYLLGFWFCLCWWLWEDARRNRVLLPMNGGLMMLLLAPVYVPAYLFQSRGWMALVTLVFYGLLFAGVGAVYVLICWLAL